MVSGISAGRLAERFRVTQRRSAILRREAVDEGQLKAESRRRGHEDSRGIQKAFDP
jgi:hypothetical protein